jgi:prophage regulatory protein
MKPTSQQNAESIVRLLNVRDVAELDQVCSKTVGCAIAEGRLPVVGVHRATIWRWTNTNPAFPKQLKLSPQCSRWKLSVIEAWEASRPVSQ